MYTDPDGAAVIKNCEKKLGILYIYLADESGGLFDENCIMADSLSLSYLIFLAVNE